ncbi:MAG: thioredoxin family protein, partial [Bacteroidota bacterium]
MRVLFLALLVAACSQASADAPADPDLQTGPTPLAPAASVLPDTSMSDAEVRVLETVQTEGIHVVHFWAPWCGNSMNELRSGLYETIEEHPDVTFTFVAVRNNGEDGADTLARYGIPERVEVLAHPGGKPVTFLGRPITW